MIFGETLKRFVEQRPLAVLARIVLMNQFSDERIQEIFDDVAETQYDRHLSFSIATRLLSAVTLLGQPSVHAVFKRDREFIPVSIVSLYGKLQRAEPTVCEALVSRTATPVAEVLAELDVLHPEPVPGYRLRIVDGNSLGATERRLKVLRDSAAPALPGLTLAVRDHGTGLISEIIACEDGHTNERKLFPRLLALVREGDLILADSVVGIRRATDERHGMPRAGDSTRSTS